MILEAIEDEKIKNIAKLSVLGDINGVYTGARLNEIAQLHLKNIIEKDGIRCFHFTNAGEDQKAKNTSSVRVSYSPRMLEAGLLQLIKKLKVNGQAFIP